MPSDGYALGNPFGADPSNGDVVAQMQKIPHQINLTWGRRECHRGRRASNVWRNDPCDSRMRKM